MYWNVQPLNNTLVRILLYVAVLGLCGGVSWFLLRSGKSTFKRILRRVCGGLAVCGILAGIFIGLFMVTLKMEQSSPYRMQVKDGELVGGIHTGGDVPFKLVFTGSVRMYAYRPMDIQISIPTADGKVDIEGRVRLSLGDPMNVLQAWVKAGKPTWAEADENLSALIADCFMDALNNGGFEEDSWDEIFSDAMGRMECVLREDDIYIDYIDVKLSRPVIILGEFVRGPGDDP